MRGEEGSHNIIAFAQLGVKLDWCASFDDLLVHTPDEWF